MRRAALAALVSAGAAGGPRSPRSSIPTLNLEGKILSATISQRFEVNDNYNLDDPSPGTSYFTDTRLNLGFLNADRHPDLHASGSTPACARSGRRRRTSSSPSPRHHRPTSATSTNGRAGSSTPPSTYRQRRVDYIESLEDFVTDKGALPDDLDQLAGR